MVRSLPRPQPPRRQRQRKPLQRDPRRLNLPHPHRRCSRPHPKRRPTRRCWLPNSPAISSSSSVQQPSTAQAKPSPAANISKYATTWWRGRPSIDLTLEAKVQALCRSAISRRPHRLCPRLLGWRPRRRHRRVLHPRRLSASQAHSTSKDAGTPHSSAKPSPASSYPSHPKTSPASKPSPKTQKYPSLNLGKICGDTITMPGPVNLPLNRRRLSLAKRPYKRPRLTPSRSS